MAKTATEVLAEEEAKVETALKENMFADKQTFSELFAAYKSAKEKGSQAWFEDPEEPDVKLTFHTAKALQLNNAVVARTLELLIEKEKQNVE